MSKPIWAVVAALAMVAVAAAANAQQPRKPTTEDIKPRDQTMANALAEILKGVDASSASRPRVEPTPDQQAAREAAIARASEEWKQRGPSSVADSVINQILKRGCWVDQDNLADARRLRAILAVSFGPDGRFREPPRLIEPKEMPVNDPVLEVFIQRAYLALTKCDAMGFILPPEFLAAQPPMIIELLFLP